MNHPYSLGAKISKSHVYYFEKKGFFIKFAIVPCKINMIISKTFHGYLIYHQIAFDFIVRRELLKTEENIIIYHETVA